MISNTGTERPLQENGFATREHLTPDSNISLSTAVQVSKRSQINSSCEYSSSHKRYKSVSPEDSDTESNVSTNTYVDDLVENLGDPAETVDHPEAFTKEEATDIRCKVRDLKWEEFLDYHLKEQEIPILKLFSAFGYNMFESCMNFEETDLKRMLKRLILRELRKRDRIKDYRTPDDVVKLLERCKNIVVLVGAGISTSLGIPDFRSSRGIYADVAGSGEVQDPQEIFNYDIFKQDPTLFYRYAHKIYPKTERVSPTHAFLRVLYEQHKLLRIYTQNIDNLEFKSGLPREKIVQCHGSFATASCMQCHQQVPGKEIERDILAGLVAYCSNPACIKEGTKTMREHANGKMKRKRRKRKNESDEEEERSQGVMKPDIIFFHENLPLEFFDTLHQKDKQKADLLIAIGTSLKVSPVAETIGILSMIPQIYISKTPVTHMNFDVCLLGPCDEIVCDLARRVNWKIDHDWISQKKSLRENVRYKRDGVLEYQWHLVE